MSVENYVCDSGDVCSAIQDMHQTLKAEIADNSLLIQELHDTVKRIAKALGAPEEDDEDDEDEVADDD